MTEPRGHGLAHLYTTARWRRLRAGVLMREPLCRYCKALGRITASSICDHIEPHRGDVAKFWSGPFQALCKTCHDGTKQQLEKGGRLRGCNPDGWPIDPNHHWQGEGESKV